MTFKQFVTAAALSLVSIVSFAVDLEQIRDGHLQAGQEIVDMVDSGNVDVAKVEANTLTLTKYTVALTQSYIVEHPEGKARHCLTRRSKTWPLSVVEM